MMYDNIFERQILIFLPPFASSKTVQLYRFFLTNKPLGLRQRERIKYYGWYRKY